MSSLFSKVDIPGRYLILTIGVFIGGVFMSEILQCASDLLQQHGPMGLALLVLSVVSISLVRVTNKSLKEVENSIDELTQAIADMQVNLVGISSLMRSLTGLFLRYPHIAKEMSDIVKREQKMFDDDEGDE